MTRGYSSDLRELVVEAMGKNGSTYESVAERFEVGRATVNRWSRRFRETGSPAAATVYGIRDRIPHDHGASVTIHPPKAMPGGILA